MLQLSGWQILFILTAFAVQTLFLIHFALRRWNFALAMRFGRWVYFAGIPAAAVSLILLLNGQAWSFWLAGFLYFAFAGYGYYTEYVQLQTGWRSPLNWRIAGPYLTLYLAMLMFYWFPLALIHKPLWYMYALLFILSAVLNIASHEPKNP